MNARFLLSPRWRRHHAAALERRRGAGTVDPDSADRRQLEAFAAIWRDAIADVPYFRSLVAERRAPRHLASWADVRDIPVLTRQQFQDHPAAFIRRSREPGGVIKTAGSTATPLQIGMDQSEHDLMRVVKLASWQDLGFDETSRLFIIWGHAHLLGTGWHGRLMQARRRVGDAVLGYRRVSAYVMTPAIAASYAQEMIDYRPAGVIAYASVLDLFARYATAFRDRLRAAGIKFVLVTSEPPPRPDSIAVLEDLFGCPVAQEYGGAEFGQIAFSRDSRGFEVYDDLNYVEAEPPGPDGSSSLLTSSLYPRYVPLIRYRVGDTVTAPRRRASGHVEGFATVGGRLNDVIPMGDDTAVHSLSIQHCVMGEPQVLNLQLLLHDSGPEMRLVARTSEADRAALEARIRGRLAQVHPRLGEVRFSYVDDLQTTRAGKRRWFADERAAVRRPS
jgi:phenylacetate-CoA ligase